MRRMASDDGSDEHTFLMTTEGGGLKVMWNGKELHGWQKSLATAAAIGIGGSAVAIVLVIIAVVLVVAAILGAIELL